MQPDYFETNWLRIKASLYSQCKKSIEAKFAEIEQLISGIREDGRSDTKSSMGDKYETGRAMAHLELEKALMIRSDTIRLDKMLHGLVINKKFNVIRSGCIVVTSLGNYFISAGLGRLTVDGIEYVAISPIAPLAEQLIGEKAHEIVEFNGKEILISNVF